MNDRTNLYQILEANDRFISEQAYKSYQTDKFPDKRIVILTCMDTRLVELLERAMGISQGQAKIIRVAGAQVHHPFGSVMHSILIAVHMLEADEVIVVGHHDCGMQSVGKEIFVDRMMQRGISEHTIRTMEHAGIELDRWLRKFDNIYDSVRSTVSIVKNHPFLEEAGIPVHGLVIDPQTGKLELVVDGYVD
ncbi:beta-class carbonic anhydrase [Effusibacillus lacus]|uniref:carbonic anhydrase n=1 Tax=Effusibacillus lacus TaxID=1348429 RepID=A0A292YKL3_9BACL|nr:carbonic anhydrase [Effusibacillus lacus]TCS75563.1 carbonic anhydrase [Effusibacillus lacus]GAX89025.1 carbonic anhydrase [Effusibacillus lacus]